MVRIKADELLNNLAQAQTKSQIVIKMFATEGAKKFQNYAKTHKRWTNRTGHAVQRLTGFVETGSDKTRIYISHGVDYGKWLERKSRNFKWIYKAVRTFEVEDGKRSIKTNL